MLKTIITVLIVVSIVLIAILAFALNKRYKNKKVSGGDPSDDETEEIDIEDIITENIYNCDFDTQKFISAEEDPDKISKFINEAFDNEINRIIDLKVIPEKGKYILSLLKVDDFEMNERMYKRFQNIISKKFNIENKELKKQRDEERDANTELRHELAEECENRSRDVSRLNTQIMTLMRDKEQLEEESCERQRLLNRHVWITRQANDECDSRLRALYETQLESVCDGDEEEEEVTIDKTQIKSDIKEIVDKIRDFKTNIEDYENRLIKDKQFKNRDTEIKRLYNAIVDINERLDTILDTKNGENIQTFVYDSLISNLDYIDYLIDELLKQYGKEK